LAEVSVGPKTKELIEVLERAASLLRRHDEPDWASWLESDRALLERGDFYGVTHFLSAFGGMGSLSDITFHASNGHVLAISDADRITATLSKLLSRGYELAKAISRDATFE
jgi:hypothetical protein